MESLHQQAKKLPRRLGVYIFQDKDGNAIYVGKSTNIHDRVKSHLAASSQKARKIVESAKKLDFILAENELEALLLEAALIKKYLPRYNSVAKDDKHPLYIKITKSEEFPKVTTSRREDDPKSVYFGPFPSSSTVRQVLKDIRKIFPYCSQKRIGKRGCFYSHLGLCDPCPSEITSLNLQTLRRKYKKQYRRNIRRILLLLAGKTKLLRRRLEAEMKSYIKKENFEEAAKIRDQIAKLNYITRPYQKTTAYLENPQLVMETRELEINTLQELLVRYARYKKKPKRIECFDVAHTGGKAATCSLVTFINGDPEKNLYRRFKIQGTKSRDDFAMIFEAVKRRTKHISDWGKPDLILIDGGKGQVSAAKSALEDAKLNIPTIGLAKKHEEIVIPVYKDILGWHYKVLRLGIDNPAVKLLQRLRDEAHRFARSYHFKLRLKELVA